MKTIENFSNPFADESSDLFNLVTKVVMAANISKGMCNQSVIWQTLFDTFVKVKEHFWSTMKERKLCTWKTNAKKLTVVTKENVIELREVWSLCEDDDGMPNLS